MNFGRDTESMALAREFAKLMPDHDEQAAQNTASYIVERIENLARFAAADEDRAALMEASAFINSFHEIGDVKMPIVRVAVLAGKDREDKPRYQFYDCRVFRPALVKWASQQIGKGGNDLQGVIVRVKIRNPFCSVDGAYLNCSGILESVSI